MLAATPGLARYSFATATILGDAGRVRTEHGWDPGLCTRVYVWTRAVLPASLSALDVLTGTTLLSAACLCNDLWHRCS